MATLNLSAGGLFGGLVKLYSGYGVMTRLIALVWLATLVPTLLPLWWANDTIVDAAAMCPAAVASSTHSLVQLYRFLVSPLVHTDFISGAVSVFALLQLGHRIEQQRGSLALAQLLAITLLLTQSVHLLAGSYLLVCPGAVAAARAVDVDLSATRWSEGLAVPVWGSHPTSLVGQSSYTWASLTSFSIPTQACSVNNWAVVFALMVVECSKLTRDLTRFVFLIPFPVPTRLIPLIFLAAFQFWFGVQLHTFVGFFVGYLLCLLPFLTLPTSVLRFFEVASLRQDPSFVSVDTAGKSQPWQHWVPEAEQPTPIPVGAAVSAANSINGPANINRTSVFVNRGAARTPTSDSTHAQWRRVDLDSSPSGSSASSPSSSDSEDVPSGPSAAPSAIMRSPPSPLGPSSAGAALPSDDQRSAIFAANVARALEISAYPHASPPAESPMQGGS